MENLKIIIVDDQIAYRSIVKEILHSKFKFWNIYEAGNADELMKIKDLHNADLILMDIMMPGMNGIELTKRLLWRYRHLKVVASTMFVEDLRLTTYIEAGFKGFISKQDLLEAFEECFSKVLGGSLYYPKYLKLSMQY